MEANKNVSALVYVNGAEFHCGGRDSHVPSFASWWIFFSPIGLLVLAICSFSAGLIVFAYASNQVSLHLFSREDDLVPSGDVHGFFGNSCLCHQFHWLHLGCLRYTLWAMYVLPEIHIRRDGSRPSPR